MFNEQKYTSLMDLVQAVEDVTGWAPTTNRALASPLRVVLDGNDRSLTRHKKGQQDRFWAHHSGGKPPKGKGAVHTEHLCVFLSKTPDGDLEISALGWHNQHCEINQPQKYKLFWQCAADKAAHPPSFTLSKKK